MTQVSTKFEKNFGNLAWHISSKSANYLNSIHAVYFDLWKCNMLQVLCKNGRLRSVVNLYARIYERMLKCSKKLWKPMDRIFRTYVMGGIPKSVRYCCPTNLRTSSNTRSLAYLKTIVERSCFKAVLSEAGNRNINFYSADDTYVFNSSFIPSFPLSWVSLGYCIIIHLFKRYYFIWFYQKRALWPQIQDSSHV